MATEKMRMRFQRGTLIDSLSTEISLDATMSALIVEVRKAYPNIAFGNLQIREQGFDSRTGWHDHSVHVEGYGIVAFLDRTPYDYKPMTPLIAVPFATLAVGSTFLVRIEGCDDTNINNQIRGIGLSHVRDREKYAQDALIALTKVDMIWARIRDEAEAPPVLMVSDQLVLIGPDVGRPEPKIAPTEALPESIGWYADDSRRLTHFSNALRMMIENGVAVRRSAWPVGAAVFLEAGSHDISESGIAPPSILEVPIALFENGDKGTTTRLPNFKYLLGNVSIRGWSPTQHDMLANDWHVHNTES